MTVNVNQAIQHMVELKNKGVTYSMEGSRTGADGTADCSGAVYASLRAAGGTDFGYVPNTETLHAYLVQNNFSIVYEEAPVYYPKKGDVFIWGKKGESAGANGHTGIFYDDSETIIHCNAYANGISINNVDDFYKMVGQPYYYVYRYNQPSPTPKRRFGYRVDDLQVYNGVWQIRNNYLCPVDFEWKDNGILPEDVDRIDPATGATLPDQTLHTGDYFAFIPDHVRSADTPTMIKGYQFMRVNLTNSGFVWLSTYGVEHLIYG